MSYQQYRPQSFQLLPTVIKNLLIINILVYLATLVCENKLQIDLADYLGLHNFSSPLFRPYQFITHMFMHSTHNGEGGFDFTHLLFNMFALWMFGSLLENYWGSKRFLIFYMVTGIGAAAVYLGYETFQIHRAALVIQEFSNHPTPDAYINVFRKVFGFYYEIPEFQAQVQRYAGEWTMHPASPEYAQVAVSDINSLFSSKTNTPMVGASGAIFGVLMAFGMLFPNTMLYVYFAIPVRAKYVVIIYGILELAMAINNNPTDTVAHFAHLGGMLFGFILIKYWKKKSNHFY